MFLFLVLTLACDNSTVPRSSEDCMGMNKGELRDDCWSNHILSVFEENEKRGTDILNDHISDPQVADYLWLMVTRDYNPSTRKYCDRIMNSALKERCMVLVSRPHLHRDILRRKTEGSNEK